MILIQHRINTINALNQTSKNYGVEIDLRSDKGKLILSHDPFSEGEDFLEWLKYYNHKFLILNVKEEGLEERILQEVKKFNITKYFFLDQSFPFLIKTSNAGIRNSAIRVSEFESVFTAINLSNKIDWVWVDFFSKFPINSEIINKLKSNNFKICLVSPELQGFDPNTEIKNLINLLGNDINFINAVCTKNPEQWIKRD